MEKYVGVVGIDLEKLAFNISSEALSLSGNNFGNMLFTNAAYKQIMNTKHLGFNWDAEEISKTCSHIFIPAANWINLKQDWGGLSDLLTKTNLPCVVVGLGAQLDSLDEVIDIKAGTISFLKTISELSIDIGVRGDFTANILHEIGIHNVKVLGCPSLFMFGEAPNVRSNFENISRIGIGPTRYELNDINDSNRKNKQRQLYQFAIREASTIYFQSEKYEIDVLSRVETSSDEDDIAKKYYGVQSSIKLKSDLLEKGKYHTSLSSWLSDVRKDDIYIGTRVHGAIAASLAGTPPILLTHDNRTDELAKFMCIPSVDLSAFDISDLYDIDRMLKFMDFSKFARRSEANIVLLKKFYEESGLSLKF